MLLAQLNWPLNEAGDAVATETTPISATSGAVSAKAVVAVVQKVLDADPTRLSVTFEANGPRSIYLGFANTVTALTGYGVAPDKPLARDRSQGATLEWWAIASGMGGGDLRILETFVS